MNEEMKQLKVENVKKIRSRATIKRIVDYTNIYLDAYDLVKKTVKDHARRERTNYSDDEIEYLTAILFEGNDGVVKNKGGKK